MNEKKCFHFFFLNLLLFGRNNDVCGDITEKPERLFELLVVQRITEEDSICHLKSEDILRKCKDAIVSTRLKNYGVHFLNNEPVGNVKTYELSSPRFIFRKQKLVSACRCPTEPAIYLNNRSTKNRVMVLSEKLRRSMISKSETRQRPSVPSTDYRQSSGYDEISSMNVTAKGPSINAQQKLADRKPNVDDAQPKPGGLESKNANIQHRVDDAQVKPVLTPAKVNDAPLKVHDGQSKIHNDEATVAQALAEAAVTQVKAVATQLKANDILLKTVEAQSKVHNDEVKVPDDQPKTNAVQAKPADTIKASLQHETIARSLKPDSSNKSAHSQSETAKKIEPKPETKSTSAASLVSQSKPSDTQSASNFRTSFTIPIEFTVTTNFTSSRPTGSSNRTSNTAPRATTANRSNVDRSHTNRMSSAERRRANSRRRDDSNYLYDTSIYSNGSSYQADSSGCNGGGDSGGGGGCGAAGCGAAGC